MKEYEFGWIRVNDFCWHCIDSLTDITIGSVSHDPASIDNRWMWEVRLPYPLCVNNRFPAGKAKTLDAAKDIVCTVYKLTFKEESKKK